MRTVALRPELSAAGLPLDLSELRAGVYFYSLLVDGKVASDQAPGYSELRPVPSNRLTKSSLGLLFVFLA